MYTLLLFLALSLTSSTDRGPGMDPWGVAALGDQGSAIDPDGRQIRALGDEGVGIDPNGLASTDDGPFIDPNG